MELLLVSLKLLGWLNSDPRGLPAYCEAVSRGTQTPYHATRLRWGRDAFETGTGVHARRGTQAMRIGDVAGPTASTAGVPAAELRREQSITVGPMSGQANVVAWLCF